MEDNQLLLPSGKIITFNDQQYDGIKKIRLWLKTKNKTFFTLSGHAGSGKSTIIKKLLDEYRGGVAVSAMTHKAKKIIARTTKRESTTLHSLLGLRPDLELETFNPNNPQFAPIAMSRINDYNWVIIDEVSQMNLQLLELIKDKTKNSRIKILFVGDACQLPPIGEKISMVFVDDEIEKHFLTKVERQTDGNPLLPIYDILRDNLDADDGGIERKTNININGDGIIFTINKAEFRKAVLSKFKSNEYKSNIDFCKGLAWKNDTVMSANKLVRDELFGKNVDIIEVGDTIMGYRSISDDKNRYNIIDNSADYYVVEKSNLKENAYGINGFPVKIKEELETGKFKYEDVFIIDVNDNNNLHLYAQMHDFFTEMGKSNKKLWYKYYQFRRNNLLMKTIDKNIDGTYRDKGKIITKDLDYGYFITVHKSQGSTYQHVTVIESDINLNWDIVERNKLRYVAMSRPERTCTVLSSKIDL
jgi:exodeoxyribonuclease-5